MNANDNDFYSDYGQPVHLCNQILCWVIFIHRGFYDYDIFNIDHKIFKRIFISKTDGTSLFLREYHTENISEMKATTLVF